MGVLTILKFSSNHVDLNRFKDEHKQKISIFNKNSNLQFSFSTFSERYCVSHSKVSGCNETICIRMYTHILLLAFEHMFVYLSKTRKIQGMQHITNILTKLSRHRKHFHDYVWFIQSDSSLCALPCRVWEYMICVLRDRK